MRGFILFIVSVVLFVFFAPFGFVYSIAKYFFKGVNDYLLTIALSIDQVGNTIVSGLFNDIMIKKGGHPFGNEDETISSVLGKNQLTHTLTWLGKALNWILNLIEKNHSVRAIELDEHHK